MLSSLRIVFFFAEIELGVVCGVIVNTPLCSGCRDTEETEIEIGALVEAVTETATEDLVVAADLEEVAGSEAADSAVVAA